MDSAPNVHAESKRNADKQDQINGLAKTAVVLEQQLFEFLGAAEHAGDGCRHAQLDQQSYQ